MGIASVFVAVTNADGSFKQPILAAFLFGVFWGAFTFLGIYLWVFSRKYRLEITEDTIEQSGVFTQRRIAIGRIQNVKWRNWPQGGSIKLRTEDSQMSIELGTSDSREQLIQFLHAVIPLNAQSGWDTFSYNHENSNTISSLSPVWVGVMFYVFAGSFVIAWMIGLGAVNLIAAIINFGFATYLLARKSQDNNAMNRSREAERH